MQGINEFFHALAIAVKVGTGMAVAWFLAGAVIRLLGAGQDNRQ